MQISYQLHAPSALTLDKETLVPRYTGSSVDPRCGLAALETRKMACQLWEWSNDSPVVQPFA
jgi:hypothetical protein